VIIKNRRATQLLKKSQRREHEKKGSFGAYRTPRETKVLDAKPSGFEFKEVSGWRTDESGNLDLSFSVFFFDIYTSF